MYKDYNMTQLTLPMETSVLISTNDISRNVNDIVETIPETEFDEFNCPNNKRIGFKRYAYRHDKNVLNETLNYMNVMIVQNVRETTMYELQFKTNKNNEGL